MTKKNIRIGVDVGGTKVNIGLVDGKGTLLAVEKRYVRDITDFTSTVETVGKRLIRDNDLTDAALSSVGVCVPGTVSADCRTVVKAPNIAILPENLADKLENAFGAPAVLSQDSRAAAYAESVSGAGKGSRTLLCFTLGTGIGTGIVIDGKIYHGALGCAGEIGHLCVKENGRPCGCGKRGCLEKYAAGGGLDITAARLLGKGRSAHDLFAAAYAGNADASAAVDKAALLLGRAVVGAVNLLSPDCVLFGGGLAKERSYTDAVMNYVRTHCYDGGRKPKIAYAALGEYAPLIGAAMIARQ